MTRADLLATLVGAGSHALEAPLSDWTASSRRFTDFLAANASKIRKKLRHTTDEGGLLDLLLELETAYLLLREKALSLEFEPLKSAGGRSPDFAVSYTTATTFMVEVTRLQAAPWGAAAQGRPPQPEPQAAARFEDMLCRKLGQLHPGCPNVLIAAVLGGTPEPDALDAALTRLRLRAEANDHRVVDTHGCRGRGDFLRRLERLSAVMVRGAQPLSGARGTLWLNAGARHPVPSKVRTALVRSHAS